MLGLPNKEEVRSLSKLGLSMVTVVFDDSVPMYFGRQLVSERLQQISSQLPPGVQPSLGLPATAFGELYQYTLTGPNMNALELKDLHEWVIKGQLRTIPGVSEVNTWGGQTKQFQIVVDPVLLGQHGLTLHDVAMRVEENNTNFGGGYIEHASEQFTLLGAGPRDEARGLRQHRDRLARGHAGAAARRRGDPHRRGAAVRARRCARARPCRAR